MPSCRRQDKTPATAGLFARSREMLRGARFCRVRKSVLAALVLTTAGGVGVALDGRSLQPPPPVARTGAQEMTGVQEIMGATVAQRTTPVVFRYVAQGQADAAFTGMW